MTFNINEQYSTTIQNIDLSKKILAVKNTKSELTFVAVDKKQITCWNIFLRFFGMGSLANPTTDLTKVAGHLNKFSWQALAKDATDSEHSPEKQAVYLKVCEIANKALMSRNSTDLYENVSTQSSISIQLRQYDNHNKVGTWHTSSCPDLTVSLNPKCQVKHVLHLASKQLTCRGELVAIEKGTEIPFRDNLQMIPLTINKEGALNVQETTFLCTLVDKASAFHALRAEYLVTIEKTLHALQNPQRSSLDIRHHPSY